MLVGRICLAPKTLIITRMISIWLAEILETLGVVFMKLVNYEKTP